MKTRKQKLTKAQKLVALRDLHNSQPKVPAFDRLKVGIEVQTWGLDERQQLVCAGVHFVPEINARYLYKLLSNHRRWRKWYDNLPYNRHEDYPAKHDRPIKFYGAHPIAEPKQTKWITIPQTANS